MDAGDGCPIERGRAVAFVSQDDQLVETLLLCLGREPKYRSERTRLGRELYRFQTKDAALYRWLEQAGLTPRKSLTLGPIQVPDALFPHLVRGLLDGDGSIIDKVWRADTSRRSDYDYEWFRVQFVSSSRDHIDWAAWEAPIGAGPTGLGWHTDDARSPPDHKLVFGKHDSIALLAWIYRDREAPCLLRKRAICDDYGSRHEDLLRHAR